MTANEKAVFIRRADINETTRKTKKMTEINFTEEIYQRTSALYSGMTVMHILANVNTHSGPS
jgi:hypothetical protein